MCKATLVGTRVDEMSDPLEANGRWYEILTSLGVSAHYLQDKHGPCPLCGGKDRFRWDDLEGRGTYICNQCGAGTGVTLVMKFKHPCGLSN